MREIIVIGGGAAGMAAAITIASKCKKVRVTVLEGLDKAGKKILATGNGRCNLTNTDLSPAHYHSSSPKELEQFLKQMPTEQTLQFFKFFSMLCDTEEMGRVYPHSRQASTVRDTLLRAMRNTNIRMLTEHRVTTVRQNKGRYIIDCENGTHFQADALVLAAGGKAAPKQGTDGYGFELARQLGHTISPLYPCLTAFRCDSPLCKGLKGVRAHGKLELRINNKKIAEEYGEIQFTDYGISGIPAFQLSCHLKPGWKSAELIVDLIPSCDDAEALHLLRNYRFYPDEAIIDALPGLVHAKLLQAALKAANIPMARPAYAVSEDDAKRIIRHLKLMRFPVTGLQGWDQAQVTGGGVKLTEINADFSSKLSPNLWLVGEVLDTVGDCGGYNLHWAWCSGILAGQSVADHFRSQNQRK